MTVGDKWGYNRYDTRLKSPAVIIGQLQECAAKGGNLLLNIGPKADGSIPDDAAEAIKAHRGGHSAETAPSGCALANRSTSSRQQRATALWWP